MQDTRRVSCEEVAEDPQDIVFVVGRVKEVVLYLLDVIFIINSVYDFVQQESFF